MDGGEETIIPGEEVTRKRGGGGSASSDLKISLGQKKKIVMLPSPDQNLKIGSVGRFFFFFFFYVP